jgi:hypothetical protein
MFYKLFKKDFKKDIRWLSILFISTIAIAGLSRGCKELGENILFFKILTIFFDSVFYSLLVNIILQPFLRSFLNFTKSFYSDEAYLTHTLPVTKNELYNSKFIQTLIFFFIGFFVILISLFVAYYSKDNWIVLTNYIKTITTGLNMSTSFFVVMFITLIFLEVFNAIQCGFYGMILGHKKNNGKLGYSVLFGFIIYLLAQTLVLALVFVYGLFDSSVMELFKTATVSIDVQAFKVLAIVASLLYLVIIFIMSILCKKELNKGINIE